MSRSAPLKAHRCSEDQRGPHEEVPLASRLGQDALATIDLTDTRAARPARPERLMTITEVADRLGVSVRHVRRLVNERRIPFVKWGHLLRFDPAEIELFIERSRVPGRF